jgi:hypothetical protein
MDQPTDPWAPGVRTSDVPPVNGSDPNPLDTETAAPLCPNKTDISRHLYALFPPEFVKAYPNAWIELATASAATDWKPMAAEHFSPLNLQEAIAYAEKMNKAGKNVYVGPSLRQGTTGLSGRSTDVNFLASTRAWSDLDGAGDFERVSDILKASALQNDLLVMTGTVPHKRAHPYFRFSVAVTDGGQQKAANVALKTLLGTDDVDDACRLMRLAGCINYPSDDKRERGYIPELVKLHIRKDAPTYTVEHITGIAGTAKPSSPFGFDTAPKPPGRDDDALTSLLEASRIPGKWHNSLRAAIATMIGRDWSDLQIRLACAPYCKDGAGDTDLDDLINRGRAKWGKHNEEPRGQDTRDHTAGPAADRNPVDLWGRFDPPELPKGLLPKEIENYAFAQGRTMGCDPGGIAMAALAVCAAAIPDRIKLSMKPGDIWLESARLWVALVGTPSTKKSPIISATMGPLARLDAILLNKYLAELKEWEQLDKDDRKAQQKPAQKRLRMEDATIEAAQEVLAGSPDGVPMVQDELSAFFGAMDKYGGGHRGAAKDRGFWLQAFNGGQYALNPISRGVGLIPNLSVSLLGGIQPDVIRQLAGESYDDGFLQRMLMIMLRPATIGLNAATHSAEYGLLVERLTKLRTPVAGSLSSDNDGILRFHNRAQDVRGRMEARHLALAQAIETFNGKLAAHIGKFDGLFGRLCVLFHCIEHAGATRLPEFITDDTAERVARFMHQ